MEINNNLTLMNACIWYCQTGWNKMSFLTLKLLKAQWRNVVLNPFIIVFVEIDFPAWQHAVNHIPCGKKEGKNLVSVAIAGLELHQESHFIQTKGGHVQILHACIYSAMLDHIWPPCIQWFHYYYYSPLEFRVKQNGRLMLGLCQTTYWSYVGLLLTQVVSSCCFFRSTSKLHRVLTLLHCSVSPRFFLVLEARADRDNVHALNSFSHFFPHIYLSPFFLTCALVWLQRLWEKFWTIMLFLWGTERKANREAPKSKWIFPMCRVGRYGQKLISW